MGLLRPLILGPQRSRFYSGLTPNKFGKMLFSQQILLTPNQTFENAPSVS